MLGHPINFNKLKWIEIQSMFFNPKGIKLEINSSRKFEKLTNIWKLNTFLNN